MLRGTDKTEQVEKRMEAIRIKIDDCCAYFEKRPTSPVNLRECWYCRYAAFDGNRETGCCRFRSRENFSFPIEKGKAKQNDCEIPDQDLDRVAGGLVLPPDVTDELANTGGGGCSRRGSQNKYK